MEFQAVAVARRRAALLESPPPALGRLEEIAMLRGVFAPIAHAVAAGYLLHDSGAGMVGGRRNGSPCPSSVDVR